MRAFDLAMLLAIFGLVLGVMDASAIWDSATIDVGSDIVTQSEFEDLQTIGGEPESDVGMALKSAGDLWEATLFLLRILSRVIFIGDIVAQVFGNTTDAWMVAGIIQVGIYLVYAIGLFQAKSGSSVAVME